MLIQVGRWLPSIFVVAAFGPYLGETGLKLEHVLVYSTGTVCLLTVPRDKGARLWGPLTKSMELWTLLFVLYTLGLLWRLAAGLGDIDPTRVLAAIEHHFQPLTIVAASVAMLRQLPQTDREIAALRAMRVLVLALALNSLLILHGLAIDNFDMFGHWLPPGGGEPDSVWNLSMQMGRYGGIFNQPFESGLTYSLGLLAWQYRSTRRRNGLIDYLLLLCLVFGGIISVSKVFILIGAPLFVLTTIGSRSIRRILNWRFALVASFSVFTAASVSALWSGLDYFLRLFRPDADHDLIDLYTANRFGSSDTQVQDYFGWIFAHSPLFGVGFAPFEVVDNGFLAAFAGAGLLGLVTFLCFLYVLLRFSIRTIPRGGERTFAITSVLLMIGGCVGAPSFTINRASTVFWALLGWTGLLRLDSSKCRT